VYRSGEAVRFGSDGEELLEPGTTWERPRIAYLHHGSDPITWLSLDLLFDRPEWMDQPRPPDVSQEMPYLPMATFLQLTVDLAVSTNVPLGHGHAFGPSQAEAWVLIAPPAGWSAEDSERLLAVLGEGGAAAEG
jgi:uncharacterized membrane protein